MLYTCMHLFNAYTRWMLATMEHWGLSQILKPLLILACCMLKLDTWTQPLAYFYSEDNSWFASILSAELHRLKNHRKLLCPLQRLIPTLSIESELNWKNRLLSILPPLPKISCKITWSSKSQSHWMYLNPEAGRSGCSCFIWFIEPVFDPWYWWLLTNIWWLFSIF